LIATLTSAPIEAPPGTVLMVSTILTMSFRP
jgi:hypothetical protein